MLGAGAAGDKLLSNRYKSGKREVCFRKVRFVPPTWDSLLRGPEIPERGPTQKRELCARASVGRHCPRTQGHGAQARGPARVKMANRSDTPGPSPQ